MSYSKQKTNFSLKTKDRLVFTDDYFLRVVVKMNLSITNLKEILEFWKEVRVVLSLECALKAKYLYINIFLYFLICLFGLLSSQVVVSRGM